MYQERQGGALEVRKDHSNLCKIVVVKDGITTLEISGDYWESPRESPCL